MEEDEPQTPECWPPNPWALPWPNSVLVSSTVQTIFQKAKENAMETLYASTRNVAQSTLQKIYDAKVEEVFQLQLRQAKIRDFKNDLSKLREAPNCQTITLRSMGGEDMKIPLTRKCNTLRDIQRHMWCSQLRRYKIRLFIPGVPEPLQEDQDLRLLLPNIPVLEVVRQE